MFFKLKTNDDDNYEGRKCTNIRWIYLMIVFFALMVINKFINSRKF